MERSAEILGFLESIGCEFPDIGLLQPADPFLDSTGEDLRRRIFLTQENSGTWHCLRPEFTIPVCMAHRDENASPTRYGYCGPVFRQRNNAPHEFVQAGYEDIGDPDRASADIACVKHAIGLLNRLEVDRYELVVGNQWIFATVLEQLEIPEAWRKKLLRAFGDDALLADVISSLAGQGGDLVATLPEPVRQALKSGNGDDMVNAVTAMMQDAGLPLTGSRTPQAIAERVIQQAQLSQTMLDDQTRSVLDTYLAIECDLNTVDTTLAAFADDVGIDLSIARRSLAELSEGLTGQTALFRARFGRRLDYYSGMVFEVYRDGADQPLIGGGRYDQLLTVLGSKTEIPAVGFAVWVDRLGAAA